ncbi:cilia- and flagella-associated protein 45-like isoform X2 [Centruroides sculpturatus]|nr:cilia- and flagella-associated protein 45-like isoform X2 [Centruroides sculpturatus]
MKYYDDIREKNHNSNDTEEAKNLSDVLNKRAEKTKIEGEEEVKHLNQLIRNVKCQAIRDKQVYEKAQIEREIKNVNQSLDEMMERERTLAIQKQEEKDRKNKEESQRYGNLLRKQIYDNLEQIELDKDQKYLEQKELRHLVKKMQLEDLKAFQSRKKDQKELMADILMQLEDLLARRKWENERKLTEELRYLAFMNEKAEREEAEERRLREEKRQREREIDELRKKQEQVVDILAEEDERKARRAQEELERKWRKRELEDAKKLTQGKIELRKALDNQIDTKMSLLASEKQKDKEEFHHVLYNLVSALENERKEELSRKKEAIKYGSDLLAQIRDNEKRYAAIRRTILREGKQMYEDEQRRKKNVEHIKAEKFKELQKYAIRPHYLAHIERSINPPSLLKRN